MSGFETFKFFLTSQTGLAKDALHIYVALGVFVGSCLIFGWKTRDWKPWMLVLMVAIGGELRDIYDILQRTTQLQLLANFHDLWNTMLVPTILLVFSRYSRIFSARPAAIAQSGMKSGNQP